MKRKIFHKISWSMFKLFLLLFLFLGIIGKVEATPIKVLSDSRHAYDNIVNTINQLLGTSYTDTDIIIHSTNMNTGTGFSPSISTAVNTTSTRYNQSGTNVSSQGPYNLFTTSASGYRGDTVTEYNYSTTYDLMHNYAYITNSTNFPAGSPPPAFHTTPSIKGYASGPGVEWILDQAIFPSIHLSNTTADTAGIMAVLRYLHPTWNWFDVKAALRQTGTNWTTGYDSTDYGFGIVSYASSTALTDGEIFLQPPEVKTATTSSNQLSFILFPFKQTRRTKEVLFQFASTTPIFQSNELTLSEIQTLGGIKVSENTSLSAQTLTPVYDAFTNSYFVWLTADNSIDSTANFSRIDTYSILGPFSQNKITFSNNFDIISPSNKSISTSTAPLFKWSTSESYFGGISKYQLFIDGILNKDNITSTSTNPVGSLSKGTHTWYVKVFNGNGDTATSTSTFTLNIIPDYTRNYTFYVDNLLGNDNNLGSETNPWKTIAKSSSVAQAGNTIVIIENTDLPYRETLTPTNNGDVIYGNITFRGKTETSKPKIWGSEDMSGGWTSYSGGNSNTYQKTSGMSLPGSTLKIFAVGSSISNLYKKTKGVSENTLGEGEWYPSSAGDILYYRLAPGEDISTLHMEIGARDYGIEGVKQYITYKDLSIKYANLDGVLLGSNSIFDSSEVSDSDTGLSLGVVTSNQTIRYSVISNNNKNGVDGGILFGAYLYNNIFNNNTIGLYLSEGPSNVIIENNISTNNSTYDFSWPSYIWSSLASNNNWSGAVNSNWENNMGLNNQDSKPPLLVDITNGNYRLKQLSPNIDAAKSISGLTTDILGNPIYGTPDIGPYEYQPPYTMGTNKINISGNTRLYADGKYLYTTATSSANTADITIRPQGGWENSNYSEYMNISISNWETSGAYTKTWTENSSIATTTVHTIGDLKANTYYIIKVDNSDYTSAKTNGSGQLIFDYSNGYSQHTFSIGEDTSGPTNPILSTLPNIKNVSNPKPTFSWDSSSDPSGIAKYQIFIDGVLNTDNISSTSGKPTTGISCGNHSWYVKAIDNAGNTTTSFAYDIIMRCDGNIFAGSLSSLPGYMKPREQTIYPDGTIVYSDEKKPVEEIFTKIKKQNKKDATSSKSTLLKSKDALRTFTASRKVIETKIKTLQHQLITILSTLIQKIQTKLQNINSI